MIPGLFPAGAAASPSLPPPLGLLTRRAPPTVTCLSPRRFAGAAFDLLVADTPVRSVSAPPGRHEVQFTLDGAVTSRCYRCRYRHRNGSAWETSAPSAEIAVTGAVTRWVTRVGGTGSSR